MSNGQPTEATERFDLWISKYPDSPTPYVARGEAFMQRGWKFRGEGWANQIHEEDKQTYGEMVIASAKYLIENEAIGSKDPHWYRSLADAFRHLGANSESFLALVNRGLDQHPNYDELYFVPAGFLSPKWGGSSEDVEAFARSAVERTKTTRGYELYARIYWAAGIQGKGKYLFQYPSAVWADMVKGMDAVLARYPSQWNINHFAYFACYKSDPEASTRYLKMIEEPIVESAWSTPMNYQKCRLNVGLAASPNIPLP